MAVPRSTRSRLLVPTTVRLLALVLGACTLYAALRYAVFAGVPPDNWPLFLGNKALSLAGLTLLSLSYLVGRSPGLRFGGGDLQVVVIKFCGLAGFSLIAMHVTASVLLMGPAYYPKLFPGDRLSLVGELSLLLGILAFWCFTLPVVATVPGTVDQTDAESWLRQQRMGYLGLATAALHVLIMGWAGWLEPRDWPASMPPITLLAFIVALLPLVVRLWRGPRHRPGQSGGRSR